MKKALIPFLSLAFVAACGNLQSNDEPRAEPRSEPAAVPETTTDYTGYYELIGTEEDGSTYPATVMISDSGAYYLLTWGIQGDAFWDNGVEIAGYLGTAERAAGGPVGIFQKQGSKLSGLMIGYEDTEAKVEASAGSRVLEISGRDLSGTYSVQGGYDSGELFNHTMIVFRRGEVWQAVLKTPGMEDMFGRGLAVDNVLVLGFESGESVVLKVYEISGGTLEGRWTLSAFDPETYQEYNLSGWEKAVRQ